MSLLLLQPGSYLLLDGSSRLILEVDICPGPVGPALLLEPGAYLLLNGCDHLLFDRGCPLPVGSALLLEPGSYLLLNGCDHLLLDRETPPPPPEPSQRGYANRRGRLWRQEEIQEEIDLELIIALWLQIK